MLLTTRLATAVTAAAAALLLAPTTPVAAQDTTRTAEKEYRSADTPVWVVVEDIEEGVHQVRVLVEWDDYRSDHRFAREVEPGDLVVTLPRTEDPDDDLTGGCRFTSARMDHGSVGAHLAERADTGCLAPPVATLARIGVEHLTALMACDEAKRTDALEDPTVRYFACYWAVIPEGG